MLHPVISAYMDSATIHGVGRVKNTKYLILKLIWIFAIAGAVVIIGLQIHALYEKYRSNPVSTNIKLQNPPYQTFPGVLLCNTNPLPLTKISEPVRHPFLYDILDSAARQLNIDIKSCVTEYVYAEQAGVPRNMNIDILKLVTSTHGRFKAAMAAVDTEELLKMSQNISDFIMTCSFAGRHCTEDSLSYYRTYNHGMCVVFNPEKMLNSSPPLVAASGEDYGLQLLLNVNQYETLPIVASSAGVFVSVFDPVPNASVITGLSKGTVVPTGFESRISVSKFEEKRVGGDDGRCNPSDEPIIDCAHKCQQKHLESKCGCYEYFFELNNGVINSSVELDKILDHVTGYKPCTSNGELQCILGQKSLYLQAQPPGCEHCKIPCNRREFDMGLSIVRWPATNYVPTLKTIVAFMDDTQKVSAEIVKEDYVALNVHLSSMTYQLMEEEYIYTDVNFVSDIGGQLGLWAGISVLSIMEVVELCMLLVAGVVFGRWTTKHNRTSDLPKTEDGHTEQVPE